MIALKLSVRRGFLTRQTPSRSFSSVLTLHLSSHRPTLTLACLETSATDESRALTTMGSYYGTSLADMPPSIDPPSEASVSHQISIFDVFNANSSPGSSMHSYQSNQARQYALADASETFCPLALANDFPVKFVPREHRAAVSSRFFRGLGFWNRIWDLYVFSNTACRLGADCQKVLRQAGSGVHTSRASDPRARASSLSTSKGDLGCPRARR